MAQGAVGRWPRQSARSVDSIHPPSGVARRADSRPAGCARRRDRAGVHFASAADRPEPLFLPAERLRLSLYVPGAGSAACRDCPAECAECRDCPEDGCAHLAVHAPRLGDDGESEVEVLREMSSHLEMAAQELERREIYHRADQLREVAGHLRQDARRSSLVRASRKTHGTYAPSSRIGTCRPSSTSCGRNCTAHGQSWSRPAERAPPAASGLATVPQSSPQRPGRATDPGRFAARKAKILARS